MTDIKKNRPIERTAQDSGVTSLLQALYDRGYADAEEDIPNEFDNYDRAFKDGWNEGIDDSERNKASTTETSLQALKIFRLEQRVRKVEDCLTAIIGDSKNDSTS